MPDETPSPRAARRTAVYRFFGESDLLLYVGRSVNPAARFYGHRASKDWYEEIQDIKVTWYPTLDEAADAEVAAIAAENPKYNIARPDEDGRFTIGVGRPAWVPNADHTLLVQAVVDAVAERNAGEAAIWAAVSDALDGGCPLTPLALLTGIARSSIYRKVRGLAHHSTPSLVALTAEALLAA